MFTAIVFRATIVFEVHDIRIQKYAYIIFTVNTGDISKGRTNALGNTKVNFCFTNKIHIAVNSMLTAPRATECVKI